MIQRFLVIYVLLLGFFLAVKVRASDISSFQAIPFNSIRDITFVANGAGLADMHAAGSTQRPRLAFYQMDIQKQEYFRLPQLELDSDGPSSFSFSTLNNITTWQTILSTSEDGSFLLSAIWTQNVSNPTSYPSFQSLVVFYWNLTSKGYEIFDRILIEQQENNWVPVSLDAVVARRNLSTIVAMITEGTPGSRFNTRVMTYFRMGGSFFLSRTDYYYNTNNTEPRSLTLSPDGGSYAASPGWTTGFIILRDVNTGTILTTANTTQSWGVRPYTLALLRGGRYLIVGDPSQSVVWGAAYDFSLGTYDPATLQPFYLPSQPSAQEVKQVGYELIAVEGDSPVTWSQDSGIANCGLECVVLGTAELFYNRSDSIYSKTPATFVWQYDVTLAQWVPWVNPLISFGPATASQTSTREAIRQSNIGSVSTTNFIVLSTYNTGVGIFWRGNMTGVATQPLAWDQLAPVPVSPQAPSPVAKRENYILTALKVVAIASLCIAAFVSILVAIILCVKHSQLNNASNLNKKIRRNVDE